MAGLEEINSVLLLLFCKFTSQCVNRELRSGYNAIHRRFFSSSVCVSLVSRIQSVNNKIPGCWINFFQAFAFTY